MPVFACQHITLACLCLHAKHVAIGITNGACIEFASKCACNGICKQGYWNHKWSLQWNLQASVPAMEFASKCAKLPRQCGGC